MNNECENIVGAEDCLAEGCLYVTLMDLTTQCVRNLADARGEILGRQLPDAIIAQPLEVEPEVAELGWHLVYAAGAVIVRVLPIIRRWVPAWAIAGALRWVQNNLRRALGAEDDDEDEEEEVAEVDDDDDEGEELEDIAEEDDDEDEEEDDDEDEEEDDDEEEEDEDEVEGQGHPNVEPPRVLPARVLPHREARDRAVANMRGMQ